jgi:hypothetical protein
VDAPGVVAQAAARATGWPLPEVGAVGALVSREPVGRPVLRLELSLGDGLAHGATGVGHGALLPLLGAHAPGTEPLRLEACSPQGRALVELGLMAELGLEVDPPSDGK